MLLAGALPNSDEAGSPPCRRFLQVRQTLRRRRHRRRYDARPRNLCVTAIGELPAGQALRRDGARADDDIWVSGQPGLAALGLAHLQGRTTLPELLAKRCVMALQRPLPRVELGLKLRGLATSAIDVSDGLLADLGHILERSGLAATLNEGQFPLIPPGSEPRSAREALQLGGGDDYELCFTTPIAARQQVVMLAAELDLPLWRIGYTVAASDERRPATSCSPTPTASRCPSRKASTTLVKVKKSTPPAPGFLFRTRRTSSPAAGTGCRRGHRAPSARSSRSPPTRCSARGSTTSASRLFLLVCYVGGVLACHRTGQALGEPDHGSIVWDEIVHSGPLFFRPTAGCGGSSPSSCSPSSTSSSRFRPTCSTGSRTASG